MIKINRRTCQGNLTYDSHCPIVLNELSEQLKKGAIAFFEPNIGLMGQIEDICKDGLSFKYLQLNHKQKKYEKSYQNLKTILNCSLAVARPSLF